MNLNVHFCVCKDECIKHLLTSIQERYPDAMIDRFGLVKPIEVLAEGVLMGEEKQIGPDVSITAFPFGLLFLKQISPQTIVETAQMADMLRLIRRV